MSGWTGFQPRKLAGILKKNGVDMETYVIVAELVGSSSGIGHMIMDSQRLLDTGQLIFCIVSIDVIGLVSDLVFKWANQTLYPWAFLASRQCQRYSPACAGGGR